MDTYSDQKTPQPETTLNSLIEGVASSRNRIEENTAKIYGQLERLGFHKPVPQTQTGAMGGATMDAVAMTRERTAIEQLEYQAVALRSEADRLDNIVYLLNNQY